MLRVFHREEKETKLFFHSGATEAFTTMAFSFSEEARLSGKELLICTSQIDHPAVAGLSEHFFGSHVKHLELRRDQNLNYLHQENFEAIKDKKDNNPDLIILYHHLWVHNETGYISDLEDLKVFKSIPDLYIHIDAVQAPGKIPNWSELSEGDLWSFSAHKFGALKGTGFTLMRSSVPFHPLMAGGGQQNKMRSGTENPMAAKAIQLALGDVLKINVTETQRRREELEAFFEEILQGKGRLVTQKHKASNTIYFYLNNLSSDVALALFDLNGLMISAGSACSSGAARPSVILTLMGKKDVAKNGLRISLPFEISDEQLEEVKQRMTRVLSKLP